MKKKTFEPKMEDKGKIACKSTAKNEEISEALKEGNVKQIGQISMEGQREGKAKRGSSRSSTSEDVGKENMKTDLGSKLTYTSEDDLYYEPGDCVYVDSQRPDTAYFICLIKEFRMSKRDALTVTVKWYYRPSEVPESVYQLLVQDRRNENNGLRDLLLVEDDIVKQRELFMSDATDTYPATALKGKCRVLPITEVISLKEYISQPDNFFYILGYDPESRRLANTKGEIRLGPSHQALLPDCQPLTPIKMYSPAKVLQTSKEALVWYPKLDDYDLMMYLRAARSMAQYAGICSNGGSLEKGFEVASSDATSFNALNVLHENSYDTAMALQSLVKRPLPKVLDKKWSDEDTKKFVKGLRQFGKNFYRIKKEFLPEKETGELVEYYYRWKKTPSAISSRPHRRHRRHNVLRRKTVTRSSRNTTSEYLDLSSCSEDDYDSDDSYKDMSLYCCRHCFSKDSKSWHHGGSERLLLCEACHLYYKKYGQMQTIKQPREPPQNIYKAIVEEMRDGEGNLVYEKYLRRKGWMTTYSTLRSGRNKSSSPVEGATTSNRESPLTVSRLPKSSSKPPSPSAVSTASTGSNGSCKSKNKTGKLLVKAKKRPLESSTEDMSSSITNKKTKPQESDEEGGDEASDDSSSVMGQESVVPDQDASSVCSTSSNNDDVISRSSPSPPLPTSEPLTHVSKSAKLVRKIVEDWRSCARSDMIYTPSAERMAAIAKREAAATAAAAAKTPPVKTESVESPTPPRTERPRQSPKSTPASITSHYESMRSLMMAGAARGEYHPHYSNFPGWAQGAGTPGIPGLQSNSHEAALIHLYPGASGIIAANNQENMSKFSEAFEQWYAPYRSNVQGHPHGVPPHGVPHGVPVPFSSRMFPVHGTQMPESLFNRTPGSMIPTEAGIPIGLSPHQHSHAHLHTHFHLYGEQQQQQLLQKQQLLQQQHQQQQQQQQQQQHLHAYPHLAHAHEQALLANSNSVSPWQSQQMLWQHPELMRLHSAGGVPQHAVLSPEELPPGHQLSLLHHPEYQHYMASHAKHQHAAALQQHMLSQQHQEEYFRHLRQRELENYKNSVERDERYASFLHKEHRHSPSQLDNVIKKNLDCSPQKKPVTIDLSNDD